MIVSSVCKTIGMFIVAPLRMVCRSMQTQKQKEEKVSVAVTKKAECYLCCHKKILRAWTESVSKVVTVYIASYARKKVAQVFSMSR